MFFLQGINRIHPYTQIAAIALYLDSLASVSLLLLRVARVVQPAVSSVHNLTGHGQRVRVSTRHGFRNISFNILLLISSLTISQVECTFLSCVRPSSNSHLHTSRHKDTADLTNTSQVSQKPLHNRLQFQMLTEVQFCTETIS